MRPFSSSVAANVLPVVGTQLSAASIGPQARLDFVLASSFFVLLRRHFILRCIVMVVHQGGSQMLSKLIWGLGGAMALFSVSVRAETRVPPVPGPASQIIDVSARPLLGNRLPECRLTGEVVLWVSHPGEDPR